MKKIMLIEAKKRNVLQLIHKFNPKHFEVEQVDSSALALSAVVESQPDLIICNIQAQPLSCFHFYKTIRQIEDTSNIPFLVTTEMNNCKEYESCLYLGIDGYIEIQNPIFEEIVDRIILKKNALEEVFHKQLRFFFHNPLYGFLLLEGKEIVLVNACLQEMLEYPADEMEARSIEQFIYDEDLQVYQESAALFASGVKDVCDSTIRLIKKSKVVNKYQLFSCRMQHEGRALTAVTITEYRNDKKAYALTMEAYDLSMREIEVIQNICRGYTNVEIGRMLFISERTVQGHRARLMGKINARNTMDILRFAVKNGIFSLS